MKEWWNKNKNRVLQAALVLYVLSLAVVTVDQVFGPWIFLPEMDRQIKQQIIKLSSSDRQSQTDAYNDLVKTKGDFAVRALIKLAVKTDNEQVRTTATNALAEITGQNFGKDAQGWQGWFKQHEKEFP